MHSLKARASCVEIQVCLRVVNLTEAEWEEEVSSRNKEAKAAAKAEAEAHGSLEEAADNKAKADKRAVAAAEAKQKAEAAAAAATRPAPGGSTTPGGHPQLDSGVTPATATGGLPSSSAVLQSVF